MRKHLNFDELAQGLHTALGALFLMIPVAKSWPHPRTTGLFLGILYAAWKEGWYDVHYETLVTRGSGWRDFSFYLLGMAMAWIVLL